MKKSKMTKLISVMMLSTLALAACGGGGKTDSTGSSTGGKKASGEQLFRVVVQQEMPSADLSVATNTISFSALNNVYEGLYRLDENSKPQPAGAIEMAEKSEDGLTYKFKLREDAKWSNGDPVVAADYVYGWQRTADPKTAAEYAYMFELVKNGADVSAGKKGLDELGIKANGDHELEVTLEQTTPYFDYLLAFPSFFPQNKKVVEEQGKDYATKSEASVYNGPFTLTDFDGPGTDTEWSYTKNDQYWDKDTVQLDKIEVKVVKEAPTSLNLFQDGQTDDVILSGELAQQMADDPQLVIQKEARTSYLEFNQRDADSPYHNENLRKAISYSIDRDAVVDRILGDGSIASTGLVPEGMSFSPKDNKDFAEENKGILKSDKEQAKKYWEAAKKELGIDSFKFDIVGDDTDSTKKILEYIQGAVKENLDGVDVTVTNVPFTVRLDRGKNGDFEVIMGGWGADYADPSSFTDLFVTGGAYNRGRYSNKEYDTLVQDSGKKNASDPEKRWDDMVQAEKLILDEMGVAPVYQKAEAHLRNSKVKGVVAHGAGATYDYKWTYISE
ncbi:MULTISPECIES: peptide ABC transporter substrate-binding protein [unclassified Enterococcus]|uniref:peptide ABC transporter substrate-binding protein n=1 Tax=unclassified Enterococcus TaxID=2608891 RepID=UPI001CE194CF|nr:MULTISPECIES: peptide ABC transporter substrate-binding protein [unclassified Enterococcus]MCA5011963.1 peptide ABC transporter substrate-binding protein [Enterococcus sp. S23]MCA5015214.1 peptide ABC transporter substrate-binding protein [Enterococcus sp. S22(2020)]